MPCWSFYASYTGLVHGLPEYKIVSVGRQTGCIFFNTDQGLSIYRDGTLGTNSWAIVSAAILNNYEISREHVAANLNNYETHDLIYIIICIPMKWLPIDFPHCNIIFFFFFFFWGWHGIRTQDLLILKQLN